MSDTPKRVLRQIRGGSSVELVEPVNTGPFTDFAGHCNPLTFRATCVSLIAGGDPPDDVFRVKREI
ncbi:MAG: hypothetical protein ACYTEQ_25740, partial [Planctomycetota bacterium]